MSLIYFLQNAGFSSFLDQASCLEGWILSPEICTVTQMQNPSVVDGCWEAQCLWPIQASSLLDLQSSRQCVYSGLWHLCLLGTFSSMESLMATLTSQCQFQSWASKERNRKIVLELGRKEEDSSQKLQLKKNFFMLGFQELFCLLDSINRNIYSLMIESLQTVFYMTLKMK